jgi:hypothetical protein
MNNLHTQVTVTLKVTVTSRPELMKQLGGLKDE